MHDAVIAVMPCRQRRDRLGLEWVLDGIQQGGVGCQGVVLIDLDVHERTHKQFDGRDLGPGIVIQMHAAWALATGNVVEVFGFVYLRGKDALEKRTMQENYYGWV